jgi:hypothetical protein
MRNLRSLLSITWLPIATLILFGVVLLAADRGSMPYHDQETHSLETLDYNMVTTEHVGEIRQA